METKTKFKIGDTFTRTVFCKFCDENKNPRSGQYCFLYGSSHENYFVKKVEKVENRGIGFTPHVICVINIIDSEIHFTKIVVYVELKLKMIHNILIKKM